MPGCWATRTVAFECQKAMRNLAPNQLESDGQVIKHLESRVSALIMHTNCGGPNRAMSEAGTPAAKERKRQATRRASLRTMECEQSHYVGLIESSEGSTHV